MCKDTNNIPVSIIRARLDMRTGPRHVAARPLCELVMVLQARVFLMQVALEDELPWVSWGVGKLQHGVHHPEHQRGAGLAVLASRLAVLQPGKVRLARRRPTAALAVE